MANPIAVKNIRPVPIGPYLPDPRVKAYPSAGGLIEVLSPDLVAGNFSNVSNWANTINEELTELYVRMEQVESELGFYKKFTEYVEAQHPGITNDFLAVEAVVERLGVNEDE